jgi:hypothetical protein
MGLHSKGGHPGLPTNIKVMWKLLIATNGLAYYGMKSTTVVKMFYSAEPIL